MFEKAVPVFTTNSHKESILIPILTVQLTQTASSELQNIEFYFIQTILKNNNNKYYYPEGLKLLGFPFYIWSYGYISFQNPQQQLFNLVKVPSYPARIATIYVPYNLHHLLM